MSKNDRKIFSEERKKDGIYLLDKEKFEGSEKVKEFSKIIDDILTLSNKHK